MSLRYALLDEFTREGFEVLEAKNGLDGLEVAVREQPDVILLDIIMPVMDGMTMLAKLRKDAWGREAKVIILTNLSDNRKIADSMERGTYDYLIKADWKIERVVSKVKDMLGM